MKVVTPQLDQTTRNVLVRSRPEGMTSSEWIRLMVEVLVRWPAESAARSELKDVVENRYRHDGFDPKAGPYKVHFRLREDHWLALAAMAQAAGRSRMDYLRRLIYMAGMYRGGWYAHYQKEVAGNGP